MGKILYFDCFSGASGDMVLGALIDAGLPLETLEKSLSLLDLTGYKLTAEKVKRSAITATQFSVVLDHEVHHHRRSLADIESIISASKLSFAVKERSLFLFRRLGQVEGTIHGVPAEQVHFHELGGVDSIVDIVGAAIAFDALKIESFYWSALPVGSGTVNTAHGILPIPAPATLQLLSMANSPISEAPGSAPGELVTPTGALLVTAFSQFKQPQMALNKVGYGAGSKEYAGWPNVLRVWLGESPKQHSTEDLVLMETNIDDMSPQVYGYLMEKLFEEKAADVWFTPIQMKKNRPAVMLSVLAPSSVEPRLLSIIMRETSTLGVRVRPVARHIAKREILEFASSLGTARAKIKRFDGAVYVYPEYEDCRRIAVEKNLPLQEVFRVVEEEGRGKLEGN